MKNQKWIALWTTFMLVTACGKSMHLSTPAPDADNSAVTPGSDTKKSDDSDPAKKEPVTKNDNTDLKPDPKQDLSTKHDGEITNVSIYDIKDNRVINIYVNKTEPSSIGTPQVILGDSSNPVGLVTDSNLRFRSVLPVLAKDAVTEVVKFELELNGVRRYLAPGSKDVAMEHQILCIMGGEAGNRLCSGQKDDRDPSNLNDAFWKDGKAQIVSTLFSDSKMGDAVKLSDGSSYVTADLKIDMRKAFGLEGKSLKEVMDWIYANSTEYAKPNYRKFRFMIANNTYVESGRLVLETTPNAVASQDSPSDASNGKTDNQVQASNPAIVINVSVVNNNNSNNNNVTVNPPVDPKPAETNPVATNPVVTNPVVTNPVSPDPVATQPSVQVQQSVYEYLQGKVLVSLTDLNVLGGKSETILQDGKVYNSFLDVMNGKAICDIYEVDDSKQPIVSDTILKKDINLFAKDKNEGWKNSPKATSIVFLGSNKEYYVIRCATSMDVRRDVSNEEVSVDQFLAAIKGILEVREKPADIQPATQDPSTTVTQQPNTKPDADVSQNSKAGEVNLLLDGLTLEFDTNVSNLNESAREKLAKISAALKKNAAAIDHIDVIGTADHQGKSASYNLDLAKNRAINVANELKKSEIGSNINYIGQGEILHSACQTNDCAQDRAVELQINLKSSLSADDKALATKSLMSDLAGLIKALASN